MYVNCALTLSHLYVPHLPQTPMDQWLEHQSTYLNVLLEMEGQSTFTVCSLCSKGTAYIKCTNCFGGNTFCKPCCLEYHWRLSFHHLFQWNIKHYTPVSLYSLGFILFLGHCGKPCPKTVEVFLPQHSSIIGFSYTLGSTGS